MDSPKKPGAKDGQIGLSKKGVYHTPKISPLIFFSKMLNIYKNLLIKLGQFVRYRKNLKNHYI